uniref:Reverse transcriptase domain-containing protein n=1 Tax=Tanacetum cinerariifolium TaxID=118510 RepID=A0A6L2JQ31_TANCI|nr:reverse transcriptase domain-containing protein [Tanacetum cinerariifolium]
MLCDAPILALPEGADDFVVYCDASNQGKANIMADALSRKEQMKPRRARAMSMTIHFSVKARILEAQNEASKGAHTPAKMLKGLDKHLCYKNTKTLKIASTARDSRVEVGEDHHRFITKLLRTNNGHDAIWVIFDRLTKYAHFLAICEDYKTERLARLYINEIVTRHGVLVSIISDRDSYSTSIFWKSLQKALGTQLDLSTTNHPQTDGQKPNEIMDREVKKLKRSWIPIVKVHWNSRRGPGDEAQETPKPEGTQNEQLYSASASEIDEKRPQLKDLPSHLEYAYLKGNESCPVIILSKLSEKKNILLLQELEKRNRAIA